MQDPAIGKEVDGYQILDVLGRGGMGVVYKAEDVALSRTVALKRIDPSLANDEAFLRRFRSEARALARIDSLHIVSVHALRKTNLGLLIVMEYVDGGTVKDRIVAGGAMDLDDALPLIDHMLAALEDAHGAGVIHRDIKPHNIMLASGGRVKVTDFGLAKVHRPDDQKTVTQGVYGTLNYMSPEQVQGLGQVDQRSDLYSLGMTIYEMITGRLPFDEDNSEFALMRAIVEEDLPSPDRFRPNLPEPLVQFVMKALAKDPSQRFQKAVAMRRALQRIEKKVRRGATASSETSSNGSALQVATRLSYAVLGVVVLVLGVGGYAAYQQLAGDDDTETRTAPPQPVSTSSTVLSVTSDPSDAAVYLNGRDVGRTPLPGFAVASDSLALRIEKSGYRPLDTTLYVADGGPPSLNVQLRPATSAPSTGDGRTVAGASDDAGEGGGPPTRPDDASAPDDAEVASDGSDDPSEQATSARGTLRLAVNPTGTVSVNGEARNAGAVAVEAGRHTLRFRHPGHGVKDTTVTVAAGETKALTCYFEQTISVNHEGAWGNVWIDGTNTGESTPHTFTRGPGTYRVELRIRREGYTVPDGRYFKSVADRRYASPFTGNAKDVTVEATFTPTRHALLFRATQQSP